MGKREKEENTMLPFLLFVFCCTMSDLISEMVSSDDDVKFRAVLQEIQLKRIS